MTPEDVLVLEPKVLTQAKRESYFENGYLLLEKVLSGEWIERLRRATDEKIEESRAVTEPDAVWDLEDAHTAETPRLRRLSSPVDHHPAFWEYASKSIVPEIVADLVGPNVKFHHSKLNFKWAHGGEEVRWQQDLTYRPHTNYSPCTVGTYLYDCGGEQGPLMVMPGSHKGELHDQYDGKGKWVGCLSPEDEARLDTSKAVSLTGPAGSLTLHNCRMLHASKPNRSDLGRPLLLNVYAAADALPYTFNPLPSKYMESIVRGERARWAHHDPRPCPLPPDRSGGYTSIFALQQKEDWESEAAE